MAQRCRLAHPDGFEGRVWLTVEEWMTYRRRAAVRYPQKLRPEVVARDGESCSACGADDGRPIQLAHCVPFKIGLIDFGLTPEWLDGKDNLCLAHQGSCNDSVECKIGEIPRLLISKGLKLEDSPVVSSGAAIVVPNSDGSDEAEFRFNVWRY